MPSKHAISVSLTEHLDTFVKSQLAAGRYRTASEVIRAGLRLLEEAEDKRSLAAQSPIHADTQRKRNVTKPARPPVVVPSE